MSSFNSFPKTIPSARSLQFRGELPGAKKKGDQGVGKICVGEGRTKRKQKCKEGTRQKKEMHENYFSRVICMEKAGGREKRNKISWITFH